ncbi:ATP-NAD kinase-like domain-containing protein [Flagelloscypha sp. PMI_526]|nr:ATP-NAD kinase-like domain-containing protein [Flagelloscypha sp. PMI_526]
MSSSQLVLHTSSSKALTLTTTSSGLDISVSQSSTPRHIPFYQVLWAQIESNIVKVTFAERKNPKKLRITSIEGSSTQSDGTKWVEDLQQQVYEGSGIKRCPSIYVIVNPHSGVRKGRAIYTNTIAPILAAAHCEVEVVYTTRRFHAYEMAKALALNKYDTLVSVSGDGLVHEIFNGFAHHDRPRDAFRTPIVPIPTGSGNGLSMNLLASDGFDTVAASVNAVKGRSFQVDICSVVQDEKRTMSFMSQALGLMADLDLGTEHLRWMGDARFVYGLLRGVALFKSCPVELWYLPASEDKGLMYDTFKARKALPLSSEPPLPVESTELPPLTHSGDATEGWVKFEEPLLYFYAGKGPYVGRDLMMWPVSTPDDGLVDIAAQPLSSRGEVFSQFLGGAEKGVAYWGKTMRYIKAHAYRIKPLSAKGFLSIDGEPYPFKEFQLEVHQALATLKSPTGAYAAGILDRTKGF